MSYVQILSLYVSISLLLLVKVLPLDQELNDDIESRVLEYQSGIDIYSNSWGPSESALILGTLGNKTKSEIEKGIREVRHTINSLESLKYSHKLPVKHVPFSVRDAMERGPYMFGQQAMVE